MIKRSSVLILILFLTALFAMETLANQENAHKGKALYLKHCEICHGLEGKGEGYAHFNPPVADLTVSDLQAKSDKELWDSIHMGVPNTAMGMWRFVLSDEDIAMVLAYVRSLSQ